MCGVDPATILTVGSAAIGTATSAFSAASKSADRSADYAYKSQLYIQNAQNANRALANTYNLNQARQLQEGDKAATEAFDVVKAMARAKGKAVAAAGEAGVEGVSFSTLLSDLEAREAGARAKGDYNYRANNQQLQDEQEAAKKRAESQINSMERPAAPSSTGLWMDVGANVIKGGIDVLKIFEKDKP